MVKVLGINSDTSVCECCGKTNLKRVVVIEMEDGRVVRYGTDCAAKARLVKKAQTDSMVKVMTYASKWSAKYTNDIIVKGIWNVFGYMTRLNTDGKIEVKFDEWVTLN